MDVVGEVEPEGVERIRRFMTARPDGFTSLAEASEAVNAFNPLRPRPRNLDGLRKNVRQRADGRWHWHWDPAILEFGDEERQRVERERLRAAAARVSVPTLLVRGAESDFVSRAGREAMRRLVPTAEVLEVSGAGHMVVGDDNDIFTTRLEEFVDSVAAQPEPRRVAC